MSLYGLVPKTLKENLEFRRDLLLWADTPDRQRTLWTACKHDVLFFINSFCWLYEPRNSRLRGTTSNVIPFITYGFQDQAFLDMDGELGTNDVGLEKSRDLGATWMFLTLFFHHWMFNDFSSFGIMSRTADLVDKPGKKDTLMWKFDFLLSGDGGKGGLPKWMRPSKVYRSMMLMENRDNGSTMEGATTTEDPFRGGRKKAIAIDEVASIPNGDDYKALAATQHATDCRIFVSTPKGASGAYYDVMHTPSSIKKIVLDWKDHPDRGIGLYTSTKGELKILDEDYEFPASYKHVLDGKIRSPYYDDECKRPGATPMSIAQELDRDYGGSDYQIFSKDLYQAGKQNLLKPYEQGILYYDEETLEADFTSTTDGPFEIWSFRDSRGVPVNSGQYVIGCDISAGIGGDYSSNSVAFVMDTVTGQQVAEFATNTLPPVAFADLVIAACKWFGNAYLVWEMNGPPGSAFTKQILERNYPYIYYREIENKSYKKKTRNPGWFSTEKNKLAVLSQMSAAIQNGEFCIRSEKLLDECRQYIYKQGRVVHSRSVRTQDHSAKGQAHGDRVIAAAIAWHASKDRPAISAVDRQDVDEEIPYGCMAWRMQEHDKRQKALSNGDW